ncbi:hypothetical protein EJB05_47766, partial [Eragrostis curvula]
MEALMSVLRRPNVASRARAALLLEAVVAATTPASRLVSLMEEAFVELVRLLRDRVSSDAAHARRDRSMGPQPVEGGGWRRWWTRACELALGALDRLCGCAEGRAALVEHRAGVAAVARRALRVSKAATGAAVRVLRSVARHAVTGAVVREMVECGAVGELCVVAEQQGDGGRTAERARETLRLHARAWRTSLCLHPHLQTMYPC